MRVLLRVFIIGLPVVMLNGCSEIYRYHPPAPVYGEQGATNPYAKKPILNPKISVNSSEIKRQDTHHSPLATTVPKKTLKTINNSIKRKAEPVKKIMSPAVLALISQADRSSQSGELESAVVTIERALRIDARNPVLTYKLALLRLKQSKPRLAENLAKKAALLSANDKHLKKQSWLLISEARRRQNNLYGANEAKLKASRL